MRQTLVKEGIQVRLPDLLGNNSEYNNQFSIQASMLEDMNRICKAIVGDAQYGRVMAGMDLSFSGSMVYVSPGYCITRDGRLIKFSRAMSVGITQTANTTFNVYANYITADKGDSNGGYDASVNRIAGTTEIINDQTGANDESGIDPQVVTVSSAPLESIDGKTFLGSIVFGSSTAIFNIVSPQDLNTYSDFMYKSDATSTLVSATNSINSTTFSSGSEIILAPGKNFVHSISFVLRGKTTNSIRLGDSLTVDNYMIRMSIYGKENGGSPVMLYSGIKLADSLNDYSVQSFMINQIIDEKYRGLYLMPSVTTALFTSSGLPLQCSASYIIEKLT